ncbi:DNA cytosine methyltransferase [Lysobacter enzymogenes]|nr:DNA cytosine methyltransferase [Lysobacter enzymogenes]QQP96494.1 DNA cytosine methyltransferase [Lysobacter enzymogenes]
MTAWAYYNEWDPYAAQWLRNLMAAGLIPAGEVDERSITDVQAADLRPFRQCHFFAGIGGWALAARAAGWPDDRELWTGSAPCQPFSVAGQGKAQADDRHLWPHLFRLARARRPAVLMGEQVAAAVGKNWFDGVRADLESVGYACRGVVVPACAVDAPHRRDRLWFVADADSERGERIERDRVDAQERSIQSHRQAGPLCASTCALAYADQPGAGEGRQQRGRELGGVGVDTWARHCWVIGHDGKRRRAPTTESGIRLLAHGVSARVGRLRAYGNAIVPQVAVEVIGAYLDAEAAA